GLGAVTDGLEERAEAEVADAAEAPLGGTHDEREGVGGEDRVREPGAIELGADEGGDVVGRELRQEHGVGHAAAQVLVRRERELGERLGLGNEDEVVVLREFLEEQAQTTEVAHVDEVRVVDERREHLSRVVDAVRLFDEALLAAEVATVGVDLEGLAGLVPPAMAKTNAKTVAARTIRLGSTAASTTAMVYGRAQRGGPG